MSPVPMRCEDVQKVVHPYLDGEFEASDRIYLERHLSTCTTCREMVAFESSFKANLHARLRRPPMPAELQGRVLAALDRADAVGEGPTPSLVRRAMPIGAALAAAAAVVIFLGTFVQSRAAESPIVEDAIRAHEKQLPVEVKGDVEHIKTFMVGKVPVPVRPPRLAAAQATLVGARLGHVRDRDAAQIEYRVGQSDVTVYVFDASGLPMTAPRRQIVENHEVFVGGERGYHVVFYRDQDVGYAFTSDLEEDEILQLVSASLDE
jgi:anti-sigma factor (TIGR02949 family)